MKINLRAIFSIFLVVISPAFLWGFRPPRQKPALKRIVIDAGHGGHDTGAGGKYSFEKDISLGVALKLAQTIEAELPEVDVVLTRTSDIYQSPPTKAGIANNNKGDLFVSIHCNA